MGNIKIEDLIEEYDNLEGRLILSHLMNLNYTALMLMLRENASEKIVNEFREIVKRRKNGEPLQYILGIWNFYGREFYVGREVLIPRPETEILVEKVLGYVEDGMEILDIGSGTGIISITIAKEKPKTKVYGVDVSQQAYDMSKRNAIKLNAKNVSYELGNLYEPYFEKKFDIIVSNPPYISKKEIKTLEKELKYEPELALYGGEDGLFYYRKIIAQANDHLKDGGYIFFEIGHNQKYDIVKLLEAENFSEIESFKDYNNFDRIVLGRKNGSK